MNLKSLSDEALIASAQQTIRIETTATTNVVRHFREIFDRDLYLARGYGSMWMMAVKEFGYDRSSAQRRVNAMELSRVVPAVLEKIDQKKMCLQTAADIQTFLNLERAAKRAYSVKQKVDLVETCSGLSVRDVQIELANRNPKIDFKVTKTYVSKDHIRVTHTLAVSIEDKLNRIKNLLSHVNPYMTREELIDFMAEKTLDQIDPLRKDARAKARKAKAAKTGGPKPHASRSKETDAPIRFHDEVVSDMGEVQLAVTFPEASFANEELIPAPALNLMRRSRYVTAENRRRIRDADESGGRTAVDEESGCVFVDEKTGRRCCSKHQVQLDHINEFSLGGSNEPDNLQKLCAKHNRYRWRRRSESHVRAHQKAYAWPYC